MARLGPVVVDVRLSNIGLFAGGVVMPVLNTGVRDAEMGKDDVLLSFYELPLVCFEEGAVLVAMLIADP